MASSDSKPELLIQVTTSPHCVSIRRSLPTSSGSDHRPVCLLNQPWCLIGHARLHEVLSSQEFKDEVGKCESPLAAVVAF